MPDKTAPRESTYPGNTGNIMTGKYAAPARYADRHYLHLGTSCREIVRSSGRLHCLEDFVLYGADSGFYLINVRRSKNAKRFSSFSVR